MPAIAPSPSIAPASPIMPGATLFAVAALLVSAWTPPAAAAERCGGTLCDLYYGGSAPEPAPADAKPAAPTPLTVPQGDFLKNIFGRSDPSPAPTPAAGNVATSAPAPTSPPLVGAGGGGIMNAFGKSPSKPCTGTICDLFHGGGSSEEEDGGYDRAGINGTPKGVGEERLEAARRAREAAAETGGSPVPALAPNAAPAQDGARFQASAKQHRAHDAEITERAERAEPKVCAATGKDLWSCYRR